MLYYQLLFIKLSLIPEDENAMTKLEYFTIPMTIALIISLNLHYPCATAADSSFRSFVYCYGNAKIWVFIEANETLSVGPDTNCTINVTIYLENLGNNIGIFLNRVTFKFEGAQLEKTISPNVTLQNSLRSWSCNITFQQEDMSSMLRPGQILNGEMNFEFRYDIIDSSGEIWSYRLNENFPATFVNIGQVEAPWINFETIFITVLLVGIISAGILLWLRIRKYKREVRDTNIAK